MLQTARGTIYNPTAPHSPLQVRMILDSGSQRSYITCRVKDALHLEAEGEQVTSIVAKEPSTQKDMIVRIGMNLHDGPNKELLYPPFVGLLRPNQYPSVLLNMIICHTSNLPTHLTGYPISV